MRLHTVYRNNCLFPGAGTEKTQYVPADVSSFTIEGLQSDSSYILQVSPVFGSQEGIPSTLAIETGTCVCLLLGEAFGFKVDEIVYNSRLLFCALLNSESDQSVVGIVTSLQVQEARGEVVHVTWVGVQGATSYRVSWRRTDGDGSVY